MGIKGTGGDMKIDLEIDVNQLAYQLEFLTNKELVDFILYLDERKGELDFTHLLLTSLVESYNKDAKADGHKLILVTKEV